MLDCARGKTQDTSTSVQATPEKFGSGDSFLMLGLHSTLIRHENGAFRKCYRPYA